MVLLQVRATLTEDEMSRLDAVGASGDELEMVEVFVPPLTFEEQNLLFADRLLLWDDGHPRISNHPDHHR